MTLKKVFRIISLWMSELRQYLTIWFKPIDNDIIFILFIERNSQPIDSIKFMRSIKINQMNCILEFLLLKILFSFWKRKNSMVKNIKKSKLKSIVSNAVNSWTFFTRNYLQVCWVFMNIVKTLQMLRIL